MPELVSNYHHRLSVFGEGLADGCEDRKSMWLALYRQIENTPPERRQITVMLGFLSSCATHDPDLYDSILNSLIKDKILGRWFPYFQLTSKIGRQGVERLYKSLDEGEVDVRSFERLAGESVGDDDLAMLIQKLILKENGVRVASKILSMEFHDAKKKSAIYSQNLIKVSQKVLLQYPYEEDQNRADHSDYQLAQIANIALDGHDGVQSAKDLCQHLVEGFQEYRISSFYYPRLLRQLAQVQPYIFLDSFIGRDEFMFRRMIFDDFERADSPVNQIPENTLINWCEKDPRVRYSLIVSSMQMYSKSKDSDELCWHPMLQTVFEKSPNIQAVLLQLEKEIYPMSWRGSRADAMAKRLSLFTQLSEHPSPEIRDWAVSQHQKLEHAIQTERENELKENKRRFESFE